LGARKPAKTGTGKELSAFLIGHLADYHDRKLTFSIPAVAASTGSLADVIAGGYRALCSISAATDRERNAIIAEAAIFMSLFSLPLRFNL
jgi:hypothetical protein